MTDVRKKHRSHVNLDRKKKSIQKSQGRRDNQCKRLERWFKGKQQTNE